jgi:hypothetical protein
MRPVWPALLLLAGCGQGAVPPAPENRQMPVAPTPPPAAVNNVTEAEPDEPPADLNAMSPRQRRAYDKGLADCRAGRYEPDPWPEAYRIGCAAANDR